MLACACLTTNYYLSPPVTRLFGARVRWDLNATGLSIEALTGDILYGRRFLEFKLFDSKAGVKEPKQYECQFNFWPAKRLVALGLATNSQTNHLKPGRIFQLNEAGYISGVLSCGRPPYVLYVQIIYKKYQLKSETVHRLRASLLKISITGPDKLGFNNSSGMTESHSR
jgi:hypothetical protein